jgi:ABC-type glycerol-3-phosphate transport system substrate-binding protein
MTLVLVLTACSQGAHTPESTTLHVLMSDDWVTPPYVAAVRDFERTHPGVTVATDKTPIRVMRDTVSAAIAEGNSPDVVQYHAFAAGAQGLAQPVDDLWTKWLQPSEFLPGAVEDVTWAGHRYGVPLDTNALLLMYNADQLTRAGLPVPGDSTTFSDLARLAKTISNDSQKAFSFPTSDWWTYAWIRANGGELLSVGQDGRPRFTLDAAPVVEAVGFLADLVNSGYAFPPRNAASSSGDALALFESGKAAMYASGSWDLTSLRAQGSAFHVAVMPRGTNGQTVGTALGGSSLFIPKGSRHRDLAFTFMLALTSDRYALRFATEEGRLPARPRVFAYPALRDPDLQTFARQLPTAHPYLLEAFPAAQAAFATALDEVLRQHADPAAALGAAEVQANASRSGTP